MRKKVALAYITNDQERKASYKKRNKGFLKKLSELCTLCDVEACCIFYSPYETRPTVWPNPEAVYTVLERCKTISPLERMKKTVDQESYYTMRIQKIHDQWYKIHKENKRRKLELYMFQVIASKMTLDCFDIRDLADTNWVVNRYLKDLEDQINKLKSQNGEGTSNIVGHRSYLNTATADVTYMSEAEAQATADLAVTMEALPPLTLTPSLDLSRSLGMYGTDTTNLHHENMDYNEWWINEPIINNNSNIIPNYKASNDGGFLFLGDGVNTLNNQFVDFNVVNNDADDRKDNGNDDDGVESSSSEDDDSDEDDNEVEGDKGN